MNSVQNSYNPYDLSSYKVALPEDAIHSVKNPTYTIKQEEKKHNKKAIVSICSITGGATLLTTGLILLQRGKFGRLESLKQTLDKTISTLGGDRVLSNFEKIKLGVFEKTKKGIDKLRVFNNFASVKDVPFCKGMQKLKMGGLCDRITNLFGKITHNTLKNSYKKADKAFGEAFETIAKFDAKTFASKNPNEIIEISGVKKTVAEWLKMSSDYRASIGESLQAGFGAEAHTGRFSKLKESFSSLQDKFWNELYKGKNVKDSAEKLSETFVLEDLASPQKLDYVSEIYKHKSNITNSFSDRCEQAVDVMNSIKIRSKDAQTYREMLGGISGNLKKLVKAEGKNSENILSELMTQKNALVKQLSESTDVLEKEKLIKIINESIENLTKASEKGQIQKLLEIQKGLLSPEEYSKLENSLNNAVNKLNKSARLEAGDFVDKIRDISSGSAVTDVMITGMSPVIGTAAALAMADSRQERRSALLKAGIPLLGGVSVSLACTAGIVPIGICLVLGAASSFVLNRIGRAVNEKLDERDLIEELNKKTSSETTDVVAEKTENK